MALYKSHCHWQSSSLPYILPMRVEKGGSEEATASVAHTEPYGVPLSRALGSYLEKQSNTC